MIRAIDRRHLSIAERWVSHDPRGHRRRTDRSHLAVFGERLGVEWSAEVTVGPADQRSDRVCGPVIESRAQAQSLRVMRRYPFDVLRRESIPVRGPLCTRKVPSSRR